jgi:hypothetical protein
MRSSYGRRVAAAVSSSRTGASRPLMVFHRRAWKVEREALGRAAYVPGGQKGGHEDDARSSHPVGTAASASWIAPPGVELPPARRALMCERGAGGKTNKRRAPSPAKAAHVHAVATPHLMISRRPKKKRRRSQSGLPSHARVRDCTQITPSKQTKNTIEPGPQNGLHGRKRKGVHLAKSDTKGAIHFTTNVSWVSGGVVGSASRGGRTWLRRSQTSRRRWEAPRSRS